MGSELRDPVTARASSGLVTGAGMLPARLAGRAALRSGALSGRGSGHPLEIMQPPARPLAPFIETLAIAAAGALAFEWLGFPAGLVSGSILAVAIAALLGRPMWVPGNLTRVVLVIVGIALGSIVTPDVLFAITAYPWSIAVLGLASVGMMAGTATYLRLVHGWSGLSALLGASPGAMSQVIALSAENNVDVPGITVVQTMRVIILAAGLPIALALLGVVGDAPVAGPGQAAARLPDLAILAVAAAAASWFLVKINFPGGWMFGAMAASAALHGSGLTSAVLPWWLTAAAMVVLGAVTGSRFAGISPRLLLQFLVAGLGSFAVSLAIAAAFMVFAEALFDVRGADVAIAYAPGAQETMMLLALALRSDPVFVGAHHLARFLIVSLTVPVIASLLVRRRG